MKMMNGKGLKLTRSRVGNIMTKVVGGKPRVVSQKSREESDLKQETPC